MRKSLAYTVIVISLICQPIFGFDDTELRVLSRNAIQEFDFGVSICKFPFEKYKVYDVPNLGKFYLDDIPDSIKSHLRQGIYWESGIGEYIKKHTKPGSIAIDLGAHIGIHTLSMSRKIGERGLVIAFEPQAKMFGELYYNLRMNRCLKNVILLPFAAGETEKIIEMSQRNPKNEGGTSLGKGGNKAKMITLDSLQLSNVSLIKIDVETYELNVLKGAKNTIRRNKPIIIFEILGEVDLDNCSGLIKEQYKETLNFIVSLGYRVERIFGNDFIAYPIEE